MRKIILIESPTTYENFKVTSVPIITPNFNLLSCEFASFTFKVLD